MTTIDDHRPSSPIITAWSTPPPSTITITTTTPAAATASVAAAGALFPSVVSSTVRQPLPAAALCDDSNEGLSSPKGFEMPPSPSPVLSPAGGGGRTHALGPSSISMTSPTPGTRHTSITTPSNAALGNGRAASVTATSRASNYSHGAISPSPNGRSFGVSSSTVAPDPSSASSPLPSSPYRSLQSVKIMVTAPKQQTVDTTEDVLVPSSNMATMELSSPNGTSSTTLEPSSTGYVSPFVLPPEWKPSVMGLAGWLVGIFLPSMVITLGRPLYLTACRYCHDLACHDRVGDHVM
jgi:hypothetical protein